MKDVTNYGDHEWSWRFDDWICTKCGTTRVSMNALPASGCSRVSAQKALPAARYEPQDALSPDGKG